MKKNKKEIFGGIADGKIFLLWKMMM